MNVVFFIGLFLIGYAYVGYPVLLGLVSVVRPRPVRRADIFPFVSIMISAYNEVDCIEARAANLLELDYPKDKMEIIIASDGSTDATPEILRRLSEEKKIRCVISPQRRGKPAMLNEMAHGACGEVFVFADARQRFDRGAVRALARCLADEEVGCVSGELMLEDNRAGAGKGFGLYWTYEKVLRQLESRIGSMLGATGAIYAVRRACFHPLPENTILDDIYIPLAVVMAGKRAVFEPAAKAADAVSETGRQEFGRKVRTLAGNFQIFAMMPQALDIFKSRIAWQLLSHKALRLFVPYLLLLVFAANVLLLGKGAGFAAVFVLQCVFYGLAYLGYLQEKAAVKAVGRLRWLGVPYEFCVLNFAAAAALYLYLSGGMNVRWKK